MPSSPRPHLQIPNQRPARLGAQFMHMLLLLRECLWYGAVTSLTYPYAPKMPMAQARQWRHSFVDLLGRSCSSEPTYLEIAFVHWCCHSDSR